MMLTMIPALPINEKTKAKYREALKRQHHLHAWYRRIFKRRPPFLNAFWYQYQRNQTALALWRTLLWKRDGCAGFDNLIVVTNKQKPGWAAQLLHTRPEEQQCETHHGFCWSTTRITWHYQTKITYKRKDGVDLAADFSTCPKDITKKRMVRSPVIMWAYPREFKSAPMQHNYAGNKYTLPRGIWQRGVLGHAGVVPLWITPKSPLWEKVINSQR